VHGQLHIRFVRPERKEAVVESARVDGRMELVKGVHARVRRRAAAVGVHVQAEGIARELHEREAG